MPIPVNLPTPPVRTQGILTSVASVIPADAYEGQGGSMRWPMEGVQFQPWSYGLPTVDEANCQATYNKEADDGLAEWITQPAFLLWRSLQCSSLSGYLNELKSRITFSVDDLISASLAAELESGSASGGIGLVGNGDFEPVIVTASAASLRAAMVNLEDHLAETLHNGIGMIHLTASLYALGVAQGLIRKDSRTATGHYVVGDAGHSGQEAPEGGSAPGDDQAWIYASSLVYYDLTSSEFSDAGVDAETFDFTRNVDRPLKERHGILVFDPSITAAALVDEETATAGGGGSGDDDVDGGGA